MEGYLWDPPEAKKAFVLASRYAHKHERPTAFTLSELTTVIPSLRSTQPQPPRLREAKQRALRARAQSVNRPVIAP